MAFGQQNMYGYQNFGYQNQLNPYSYNQGYNQAVSQNQTQYNQPFTFPNPTTNSNQPSLFGKYVDGIEMVKAMDQPIGSSGIYPKADMSEIFVKGWNNDGTTFINNYKLIEPIKNKDDNNMSSFNFDEKLNTIQQLINSLEKKIDGIKLNISNDGNNTTSASTTISSNRKKKSGEVTDNE